MNESVIPVLVDVRAVLVDLDLPLPSCTHLLRPGGEVAMIDAHHRGEGVMCPVCMQGHLAPPHEWPSECDICGADVTEDLDAHLIPPDPIREPVTLPLPMPRAIVIPDGKTGILVGRVVVTAMMACGQCFKSWSFHNLDFGDDAPGD